MVATRDDKCNVSYPQSRDGKAILTNLPRQEQKWIEFIALTSQPNGKSANSMSATHSNQDFHKYYANNTGEIKLTVSNEIVS